MITLMFFNYQAKGGEAFAGFLTSDIQVLMSRLLSWTFFNFKKRRN